MKNKALEALTKISDILNSALEPSQTLELILAQINNVLGCDKALILFLDGDNLVLKSSIGFQTNQGNALSDKKIASINLQLKKIVKNKETIFDSVLNSTQPFFLNTLNLGLKYPLSYISTPLKIRDTMFGLIVLIKERENFYSKEDAEIAKAFANAASYSVKDAELSSVFKMQLKILKENVIERTKALETIKKQNVKILEADKLKNDFLANISHELRTPLNAIIGFSEALKLKIFGKLNEKQEEYVDDIHSSGLHLLGMINDLLDLSKIEANEMKLTKKDFDVISAIREVINIVSPLSNKKNISVEMEHEASEVNLNADYRRFQQILYNLLSNAIKFSDENGKIQIVAEKNKENVTIWVKDNGVGINGEFHEKIFNKFQQVDASYVRRQGSTGLGLAITRELVEMHGGKIWVESEEGKGAKFIVVLPLLSDICSELQVK